MKKHLNILFLRWLPLLFLLAIGLTPGAVRAQLTDPDLDQDGYPDLIWQNSRTGDVTVWYMEGANWTGYWDYLAQGIPTEWKIVGTADLDYDGNTDLIWQNNRIGDAVIWYMEGAYWTGYWDYLALDVPIEWKIVGVVDFLGDGASDLVWQNNRTGDVVIWYMDGASWTGYWDYLAQGIITDWKIAGTTDLDYDGISDLIWQNSKTGDSVVWYMDGANWTGYWDYLAQGIATDWKITGTADLDGDGESDLVWQNNRIGDVVTWYMDGASWTGYWDYLALGIPIDWKIVRPH